MKHTRDRLHGILQRRDLDEDERLILKELLRAGYGENGAALGWWAALPAEQLAERLLEADPPEEELTEENYNRILESKKRRVRSAVNTLILRFDIPICCEPGPFGGYYLPAEESEIERHYRRFHARAMTGLMKATRARRAAYADAVLQLSLDFDSQAGEELRRRLGVDLVKGDPGPPVWVKLVTQLLERIEKDPVTYADQLRAIQERFGDIFVPREKVAELKAASAKLQAVLASIEGGAA